MPIDLRSGIVRLLAPDGTTAGTGFVVSADGLIATCSHVVQDEAAQQRGDPRPETVQVVFAVTGEERTAHVDAESWRTRDEGDIAILQLPDGLPESAHVLPLSPATHTSGHRFRTRGFRDENERVGGGDILGFVPVGPSQQALQLRSQEVTQGYSGAPVWDEQTRSVVGMVSDIAGPDEHGRHRDTAFATPSESLRAACSALVMGELVGPPTIGHETASVSRSWDDAMTNLRNVLAGLFPSELDSRRIIDAAGLPSSHIAFHPAAITNWHNILVEAQRRGKVPAMIEAALEEYPDAQELKLAPHEAVSLEDMAGSSKDIARLPTVPEYTLQAVAQQTGVPPDTLRSWERRHRFPVPVRNGSNRRLYSERDISAIHWLRDQTDRGQSIREAVQMLRAQLRDGAPAPTLPPVETPRTNVVSKDATPRQGSTPRPLRVFLCHSSGDKPAVRDLYARLIAEGVNPWLDEEDLLPGQDWELEISKAVRSTDVVIVCMSGVSVTKTGYLQKEIRFALDAAERQPEGTIFVIPLRLEECEVPERLARWHRVDLFSERGFERLLRALQARAQELGVSMLPTRSQAPQQANEPEQVGARTDFEPTKSDMRVIAAVGRLVVETGRSHTSALYLQEAPELAGVSQEDIFESVRVLKNRDLVAGANGVGQGRWEIGLTSDGLEMWLLNFEPNYAGVQRQIARAIALDGIRDPSLLSQETGVPATIVDHVLQRWAARKLVILNRLYDGRRIDRYSPQIRQLADSVADREPSGAGTEQDLDQGPRYRTVARFIDVDVVALSDFGGELGDPVAGAVKVDGWTVVQVVAPSARSRWGQEVEEEFRAQVRRLATSHDLLGRRGPVRVVWDPPQTSAETRDVTDGELVERRA